MDKLKNYGKQFGKVMAQPVAATLLGLLVGAVFILVSHENPIEIYMNMFEKSFFNPYYLTQTLTRATPIIICGIATAAAWRAGYINIGVEGQMITGAFAATVTAIYVPLPGFLLLPLSILAGIIAGGLYATLVAVLNMKFQSSIVICTLMLNYVANYIASYLVSYPFKDKSGDGLSLVTKTIPESTHFLQFSSSNTLNLGIVVAAVITILFFYMERKTVFGYESKMTGLNPHFAKYGGVFEKKVMLKTMALSGAIAAVAGMCEIFGYKYRYTDGMFTSASYAWTGLMAALIADLHPVGILVSSIFLSGLQVGGQAIQRSSSIPLQMATVIQSTITLFVLAKIGIKFIKKRKLKMDHSEGGGAAA